MISNETIQPSNGSLPDVTSLTIGFIVDRTIGLVLQALEDRCLPGPKRPTKADLRAHFEELLLSGDLTKGVLVDILTELEGWGNQQIYLLKCSTSERILKRTWFKKAWVRDHLREVDPSLTLDAKNPTALPESPKLIAVYYYDDSEGPAIRFVWAQRIVSKKHDPSLDYEHEGFKLNSDSIMERIFFEGYREKIKRGIISFDWHVRSGEAMLLINKRSEREYEPMRRSITRDLNDFFENVDFEILEIRPAIGNRHQLTEFDANIRVRFPRHDIPTTDGNRIALMNLSQESVSEDSEMADIQNRQRAVSDGNRLDIRWEPNGTKEFRVLIQAERDGDQRIGIDAQRSEKAIRDVVRGIRYCL